MAKSKYKPPQYLGINCYIKPTYIVTKPEYDRENIIRSKAQLLNNANLSDNKHKGKLSKKAETRLKNAVNWLVSSAKRKRIYSKADKKIFYFKINFITLTLPDTQEPISEKDFKTKLLHTWLIYAQKYFYLKNYIWKLEFQKNGKLHVHITSDTFIHHKKLRDSWNRILKSNGYLNDYFNKFNNYDPNSTDIHSVKNIKNISAYLSKYLTKSDEHTKNIKGKIWGCNRALSDKNKCNTLIFSGEESENLRWLHSKEIEYKAIMSKPNSMGSTIQLAEIFFMNDVLWQNKAIGEIKKAYDNHRYNIRHNIEQAPPEYYEL
jgi:hypothetical protein